MIHSEPVVIKNCNPLQKLTDIILTVTVPAILLMLLLISVEAQALSPDTLCIRLHYPQGNADVDCDYAGNDSEITCVKRIVSKGAVIRSIDIVSGASPEGDTRFNRRLSENRSAATQVLLDSLLSLDRVSLTMSSIGIDWNGLADRLLTSTVPYSAEAAAIISNSPEWIVTDGEVTDSRKLRLRSLRGGEPWSAMADSIFPELRVSCVTVIYDRRPEICPVDPVAGIRSALPSCPDTLSALTIPTVLRQPAMRLALTTNLLYDALTVPNLGLQLSLRRGVTIGLSAMYAWWSRPSRGVYHRLQGADLTVSKYFGDGRLLGHHIGVVGSVLRYDICPGKQGQLSGGSRASFTDHPSWFAAVEYGYSFALGGSLRLDLSVAAGYLSGRYMCYRVEDGHSIWESTHKRKYLGPLKAGVSLVWLLRKGGGR